MANKSKRKAFGPKRKKLHDLHHQHKKKKEPSYELLSGEDLIKHQRVDTRNI